MISRIINIFCYITCFSLLNIKHISLDINIEQYGAVCSQVTGRHLLEESRCVFLILDGADEIKIYDSNT